jgi:YVTN family beta-propeller protein
MQLYLTVFQRTFIFLIVFNVLLLGQTPGTTATFGQITTLGETPADIVLDELRGRLYLTRPTANRVDIYDYVNQVMLNPITVQQQPSSAAMSMDGAFLYVANTVSTSMSVINLGTEQVINTVSLPARPEGVAVGADGRVLITTQGVGVNNAQRNLLVYDQRQDAALQLADVPNVPQITGGAPTVLGSATFPGRLTRTADGNSIVGMAVINAGAQNAVTTLFVYEVASGTVLRNRIVTGQSTVLAMSPDSGRFMAGGTQFDFGTLNVNAQFNAANLPFTLPQPNAGGFPVAQNRGGAVFSPDGNTIYAALNYTATLNTQRPTANVLLVGNARNLGVRLGIRLRESVLGKMVITSDAQQIFALSESGFLTIPIGKLFDYPILEPETTQVFMANDPCNKGIARAAVRISNIGGGRLTYSVPALPAAVSWNVSSGLAPATLTFTLDPGRINVNRRPGTNVYNGNNGSPVVVNISSPEAINIPPSIRVYMNFRASDERGLIYPLPTLVNGVNGGRGLRDLVLDEARKRIYIANSAMNRIEIFDMVKRRYLDPIEAGQFPESLVLSPDRSTLYVGNAGGESLMTVDLEALTVTGNISFPAAPRSGAQGAISVQSMASTISGLQLVMSNGTVWRAIGNEATVRPSTPVLPASFAGGQPRVMASTQDGLYAVLVATPNVGGATPTGYLYDARTDAYSTARTVLTQPFVSFAAPLAASATGDYFLLGGQILGGSLTPIGGTERPGGVQTIPNPTPGQPPIQIPISLGQRNVFSVWPVDFNRFLRVTTPVRASATAVTRDDERSVIELVDIRTQSESVAGIMPENPAFFVPGNGTVNVPPRQMAVDSQGNVWILTLSGLTLVPTSPTTTATRPAIPLGSRGIVNANDGSTNFRPGSFIAINGRGLAETATADTIPLPSVLGGACVTFNDVPLPLISTADGQILAQVPETVRPGLSVVQVRSLLKAQQSDPITVTVQR